MKYGNDNLELTGEVRKPVLNDYFLTPEGLIHHITNSGYVGPDKDKNLGTSRIILRVAPKFYTIHDVTKDEIKFLRHAGSQGLAIADRVVLND